MIRVMVLNNFSFPYTYSSHEEGEIM